MWSNRTVVWSIFNTIDGPSSSSPVDICMQTLKKKRNGYIMQRSCWLHFNGNRIGRSWARARHEPQVFVAQHPLICEEWIEWFFIDFTFSFPPPLRFLWSAAPGRKFLLFVEPPNISCSFHSLFWITFKRFAFWHSNFEYVEIRSYTLWNQETWTLQPEGGEIKRWKYEMEVGNWIRHKLLLSRCHPNFLTSDNFSRESRGTLNFLTFC